jgi:hypothetical protein
MSPTLFRCILIAYLGLAVFSGTFNLIFPSDIPEALTHAQQANYANLSSLSRNLVAILGGIALVGGIASALGLYLFRPWAPRMAAIVTVLAFFIWPLLGIRVVSGWQEFLSSLSTTLWGAIIALAYFSQLEGRFVATR